MRPLKVRSHLTRFYRAVQWDYVRLVVGYSAGVAVLVYVALGRMA